MTEELLQRLYDELDGLVDQAFAHANALADFQQHVLVALATVREVDRFVDDTSAPSEH